LSMARHMGVAAAVFAAVAGRCAGQGGGMWPPDSDTHDNDTDDNDSIISDGPCPMEIAPLFPEMGPISFEDQCSDPSEPLYLMNSRTVDWFYYAKWPEYCASAGYDKRMELFKMRNGMYDMCSNNSDCNKSCKGYCAPPCNTSDPMCLHTSPYPVCVPDYSQPDHDCLHYFEATIGPHEVVDKCGGGGGDADRNPCQYLVDEFINQGCGMFLGEHRKCNGATLRNVEADCGSNCMVSPSVPMANHSEWWTTCSDYCHSSGLECVAAWWGECDMSKPAHCGDMFGSLDPSTCKCAGMWNGMNAFPNGEERMMAHKCMQMFDDLYVPCIEHHGAWMHMPSPEFRENMVTAGRGHRCVDIPQDLAERIRAVPCGWTPDDHHDYDYMHGY